MTSTWSLCPSKVAWGDSVVKSHNLTVVSPDPDARYLPSGENCVAKIASAWPFISVEQRVTGRTLNTATGEYITLITLSSFVFSSSIVDDSVALISVSSM